LTEQEKRAGGHVTRRPAGDVRQSCDIWDARNWRAVSSESVAGAAIEALARLLPDNVAHHQVASRVGGAK
jgi:hypothetical protein